MQVETTRFGTLHVDGSKIIEFRDGLLGFPNHRRFALIQTSTDPVFFWLQSVDSPNLAFVVCDPQSFVSDYQISVRNDDLRSLQMADIEDSQVLVIVNRNEGQLTANLLGPLVIGASSLLGKQLVLSDKKYSTQFPLMSVAQQPAKVEAQSA